MLTADLVDARKKDGELLLRPLDAGAREEAMVVGGALVAAAQACVGRRREELEERWDDVVNGAASRFKVAAGLRKLTLDACVFEADAAMDPAEMRRVLFTLASERRRALRDGEAFCRSAVLTEIATDHGLAPEALERLLFADLRSEHVLQAAPTLDAQSLVEAWELGQAQAVLLTAVRITCEVSSASAGLVRTLFAKLKFQRLLFSAERVTIPDEAATEKGARGRQAPGLEGWRVVIDGPYSMFDAVTKYGIKLALALPALRSLERWTLVADIRWGKSREPLVFRLSSPPPLPQAKQGSAPRGRRGKPKEAPAPKTKAPHLSDDVRGLLEGITKLGGAWRVRPATLLLEVPGAGLCIPDLVLTHAEAPEPIYVEVLGFWSRDAVFRRVELAERGLSARVVFAVSARLRVSPEVLDARVPSCLYVYKTKMSPRAVLEHAAQLAGF